MWEHTPSSSCLWFLCPNSVSRSRLSKVTAHELDHSPSSEERKNPSWLNEMCWKKSWFIIFLDGKTLCFFQESLMDGILEDAGLVFQGQGIVHEDRRYWEVKDRRPEVLIWFCVEVVVFLAFLHPRAALIWGLRMLRLGISMSTPKFRWTFSRTLLFRGRFCKSPATQDLDKELDDSWLEEARLVDLIHGQLVSHPLQRPGAVGILRGNTRSGWATSPHESLSCKNIWDRGKIL